MSVLRVCHCIFLNTICWTILVHSIHEPEHQYSYKTSKYIIRTWIVHMHYISDEPHVLCCIFKYVNDLGQNKFYKLSLTMRNNHLDMKKHRDFLTVIPFIPQLIEITQKLWLSYRIFGVCEFFHWITDIQRLCGW